MRMLQRCHVFIKSVPSPSKTSLRCVSPKLITIKLHQAQNSLPDLLCIANEHASNINSIHLTMLVARVSSFDHQNSVNTQEGADILSLVLKRLSSPRVKLSLSTQVIASLLASLGQLQKPRGLGSPFSHSNITSIAQLLLDELFAYRNGSTKFQEVQPGDLMKIVRGISRLFPHCLATSPTLVSPRSIFTVVGAIDPTIVSQLSNKDLGQLSISAGKIFEGTSLAGEGAHPIVSFSSLLCIEVQKRCSKLDLRTLSAVATCLSKTRYRCRETLSSFLLPRLVQLIRDDEDVQLRDLAEAISSLAELQCPGLKQELFDHQLGRLALERSYSTEERSVDAQTNRRRALLRIAWAYAVEMDDSCYYSRSWIDDLMETELFGTTSIETASSLDLAQTFHWMLATGRERLEGQIPSQCRDTWIASIKKRRLVRNKEIGSLQAEVFRVCQLLFSLDAYASSDIQLFFEHLTPDGLLSIDIAIIHNRVNTESSPSASRVAIEVDGPSHYSVNVDEQGGFHSLGSTMLRDRVLARQGWMVISIPWWEWRERGEDDSDLKSYLSSRLASVL
jgi:hypothetical protein